MVRLFKVILTLLLFFIFMSCSDEPNLVGVGLLSNSDLLDVAQVNSMQAKLQQQSKFYTDSLNLTSSKILMLGKHDNVESTMLMKFLIFLPDSLKEAVNNKTLQILSSTIEMDPIYTYADKSNPFDFTVHKINSSWNSLTFTKDSLASLDYDDVDRSSNRVYEDTLITFDFDQELAKEWLELSASADQVSNKGLYFNYTPGSDKIIGFPAISYSNENKLARLKIIVEVPNSFVDTIVVPVTSDVHVVDGELPIGNSENIFVQGGITVRSSFKIDISMIPDNTIINKATLRFYYDDSESLIGTKPSDSLGVLALSDYELNKIDKTLAPTLLRKDSTFYSGDITGYVQRWVSDQENNGLQIFLANELSTVNKVALKGSSTADENLKPYLEIIYTAKK
ncbi:MAG: DNRLRE domain-containing protein [Chlorobi bacterium]|nr:DNRLRE domain-containing protein [Chlorobiota bacterium]